MADISKDALEYHSKKPKGKMAIKATKNMENQSDLSLAYTPGVASPCLEIKRDKTLVWEYTSRSNMVAVVSDGSAVLGLGDIGPYAGIPVMEGKCVLFKRFADVDAFPICLDDVRSDDGKTNSAKVIKTVKRIAPVFGGINLEDIASPACFEIEAELKKNLEIPVFHDDQHGTAIITLAALMNSLRLVSKHINDAKVVFNGAGAAGIACANFYISAGVRKENLVLCDSHGVVYKGREEGMNLYKEALANDTKARTLAEAMKGADVFVGVSAANCVTKDMVRSMAEKPVIFAMANPVPEISYADALEAGAFIVGTGRSDFPNQVNNVLGFPGIFRGALDTRARQINEEMKIAASEALAEVANEKIPADVLESLKAAYPADFKSGVFEGENPLKRTYVIPKPLDPRVVPRVARKVAEAAMGSGVAQVKIGNPEEYERDVAERIRKSI